MLNIHIIITILLIFVAITSPEVDVMGIETTVVVEIIVVVVVEINTTT